MSIYHVLVIQLSTKDTERNKMWFLLSRRSFSCEREEVVFIIQSFTLNVAMIMSEKCTQGSVLGPFHHGMQTLGLPGNYKLI